MFAECGRQHLPEIFYKKIGIGPVAFIDHEYIRDLHQAGFHCLYLITCFRNHDDYGYIRQACDLYFTLSNANRFDDDMIECKCFQQVGDLDDLWMETSHRASCCQ